MAPVTKYKSSVTAVATTMEGYVETAQMAMANPERYRASRIARKCLSQRAQVDDDMAMSI